MKLNIGKITNLEFINSFINNSLVDIHLILKIIYLIL